MNITFEERQLMSLYNTGTRTGLIAALAGRQAARGRSAELHAVVCRQGLGIADSRPKGRSVIPGVGGGGGQTGSAGGCG